MPTFNVAVYMSEQETPVYIANKKQIDEAGRKAVKKELKNLFKGK